MSAGGAPSRGRGGADPDPIPAEEAEALDAYSHAVTSVAERLAPSVANLRVMRRGRGGQVPAGAGSAVVLTPDGFLLTSAHVVAGPGRRGRAAFTDGRELAFEIVGQDPLSDLALLRTEGGDLQPAELGDAERLRVGQLVVAIGNPHGFAGLGDRGRGVGAGPLAARALPPRGPDHRQRDPDRRRAQPRQLRRGARGQPRARGRDQHGGRRRRPRARGPDQRRHPARDRPADERRPRAPRLPRHRGRPAAAASSGARAGGAPTPASRSSRSCATARPSGPACAPRT